MNNNIFVETIKIENGLVHQIEFHQKRMAQTAFHHFGTKPKLDVDISNLPENLKNGRVKCRVLYGKEIISVEFHPYTPKKISSLKIVGDNTIDYSYKSTDRTSLLRLLEKKEDADDIIIVKNGEITDSSYSNLVFETHSGELFTPKTYLLNGTKRQFLLQNGTIGEREIKVADLCQFRQVYFINSMLDLEDNISVPILSVKF